MNAFGEIQRLQTRRDQIRENSAREIFEVLTLETTGVGQSVPTNPIMFKGPFTSRPAVMYGSEIVAGLDPTVGSVPLCSGSVFKWVRDERNFYIGAYLAARVDAVAMTGGAVPTAVRVRHSFVLLGVSLKDFGPDVTADLAGALDVREVTT